MLDSEQQQEGSASGEEIFYKTKVVQFLGRDTSIILQNDNGPCPLLAICNVLLLRNQLSLSLDVSEVSLQKLLSLVAERLIDFNSNVQDKDDGYVNNQQQNISDAIDLLPRLATGIDVNVHFRRIDDFEFTRECAIFDLLDIGLYHGWIVDPQDADTATAIGSKSYNTLVAELVQAFEAKKSDGDNMSGKEDDCVDFAAATTATLGVPSPSLSRGRSFDDRVSDPAQDNRRKGDIQEQVELMRASDISRAQVSTTTDASMSPTVDRCDSSLSLDENEDVQKSASGTIIDALDTQIGDESNKTCQSDMPVSQKCYASGVCKGDVLAEDIVLLPTTVSGNSTSLAFPDGSAICENSTKSEENISTAAVFSQVPTFQSPDGVSGRPHGLDLVTVSGSNQSIMEICSDDHVIPENPTVSLVADSLNTVQSSNGEVITNASEVVTSSVQGTEPIYEGEECILRSGFSMCENAEPVYEGEMILAGTVDKTEEDSHSTNGKDKIAHEQWHLIKNFLERNANQLTIYGLFCLQEGLKERELCVFFRNNHFSTIFKLKGELYLLATDQGYMNQPDLVWEKLNEVNGDTVFMTGNFTQFKIDSQVHDSWNEQSAMNSTSDYLAALETSGHPSSALNSDLQLAIALQQQEFEQESQRGHQQHSQQSSIPGRSRLTTGPQVSRNSDVSQKSESKIKEKCIVM